MDNKNSFSFLSSVLSLVSNMFFTNCCVNVLPPSMYFIFTIFLKTALAIASKFTPSCSKNIVSSIANNASMTRPGISSYFVYSNLPDKSPFATCATVFSITESGKDILLASIKTTIKQAINTTQKIFFAYSTNLFISSVVAGGITK